MPSYIMTFIIRKPVGVYTRFAFTIYHIANLKFMALLNNVILVLRKKATTPKMCDIILRNMYDFSKKKILKHILHVLEIFLNFHVPEIRATNTFFVLKCCNIIFLEGKSLWQMLKFDYLKKYGYIFLHENVINFKKNLFNNQTWQIVMYMMLKRNI